MYPDRPPFPVSHGLHIALSVFTAGMWLPIYAAVVINHGRKMRRFRDAQIIATTLRGPARPDDPRGRP